MKEKNNQNIFKKNIRQLSVLSQYNTERSHLIRRFADHLLETGHIFREQTGIEDIKEFCENERDVEDVEESMDQLQHHLLFSLAETTPEHIATGYVLDRYEHVNEELHEEFGFDSTSLILMENVLGNFVYMMHYEQEIADKVHEFDSKEQYADLCFVAEPDNDYRKKWFSCISLPKKVVVQQFVEQMEQAADQLDESFSNVQRDFQAEAEQVLTYLSLVPGEDDTFTFSPILIHGENIVIPFPRLLRTTTHFRVEALIDEAEESRKKEMESKGETVEYMATDVLNAFPNRNIVKNAHYKIGETQYETDAVLFFDDAVWAIEIKSHPLFKRIPFETERVVPKFNSKIREGWKQGARAIRFLNNNPQLVKYHTGKKNLEELLNGVIVVLDGFLPTFFTQGERVDTILGTDSLHTFVEKELPEDIRVYVITLLDLYELSRQPDREHFEEFLDWRTRHLGTFPIQGYNEVEYWAYAANPKNREIMPKLIEKELVVPYTSSRFNNKRHLRKLTEEDQGKIRQN